MVTSRGKGVRGGRRGKGGIDGDGRRLDLGWWTHNTIYSWCVIELYMRNLRNFINKCHLNKFNLKNNRSFIDELYFYHLKEKASLGKEIPYRPWRLWAFVPWLSVVRSMSASVEHTQLWPCGQTSCQWEEQVISVCPALDTSENNLGRNSSPPCMNVLFASQWGPRSALCLAGPLSDDGASSRRVSAPLALLRRDGLRPFL